MFSLKELLHDFPKIKGLHQEAVALLEEGQWADSRVMLWFRSPLCEMVAIPEVRMERESSPLFCPDFRMVEVFRGVNS